MIRWEGEGILLAARRHGEGALRLDVLTAEMGRLCGVLPRGGARGSAGRGSPNLQPGADLTLRWQARLAEHIGRFTIEVRRQRVAPLLDDPLALAALASVSALLLRAMPERNPMPALHAATAALLDRLEQPGWAADYIYWELVLLRDLGFGLDLDRCAVTGGTEGLCFVSPRTGRAVCSAGAAGYEDRLLALPAFLTPEGGAADQCAILAGLTLTGAFIARNLTGGELPEPRLRLQRLFEGAGPDRAAPA